MKRLACFVLIALATAATGCRDNRRDVVVIPNTNSYHLDKCPRVKMANTEIMPIEKARALQLKACPGCKPDSTIK